MISGYVVKHRGGGGLRLFDYLCDEHGRFEALVELATRDEQPCPACGAISPKTMSAPAVHTQFVVSATQGKSSAKPHPMSMDLRNLGEGQAQHEWKAERDKLWQARRENQVKELLK